MSEFVLALVPKITNLKINVVRQVPFWFQIRAMNRLQGLTCNHITYFHAIRTAYSLIGILTCID